MLTEILSSKRSIAIPHAIDILKHGGLVAFPTDTVYGVAALASSEETIERLFIVKGRKRSQAVAILIAHSADLELIATDISPAAKILSEHYWPGPLTIILKRKPNLPKIIAPSPTVGVRIPNHPFALKLLAATGPLAVTSANRSGEPSPVNAQEVLEQLGGRIHLLIDGGKTPGQIPSTVIDCTNPEIKMVREGPISLEELLETIHKEE